MLGLLICKETIFMIFTFYVTNIGCFGKSKGVVSVESYEKLIIQD